MTRAQALVDAQRALKAAFPDRWVSILAALERRVLPEVDAPICPNPKCGAPTGTPISESPYPSRDGNLACPACGQAWTGTAEEVAQAIMSAKAYADANYEMDGLRNDAFGPLLNLIGSRVVSARCDFCNGSAVCLSHATQDPLVWTFTCEAHCSHDAGENGVPCTRLTAADPRQHTLFDDKRT